MIRRSTVGHPEQMIRQQPATDAVTVWWHRVDRPSLILGSGQGAVLDVERALHAGWTVIRRRSGGGLVVATPNNGLWLDVVLPRTHPLWDDDVLRAFLWLGDAWARALAGISPTGVDPIAPAVHRGPSLRPEAGKFLCFAGLGPGEVTVADRKVVGLSQRRTRDLARFQCQFLLTDPRHDPALLSGLVNCFGDDLAAAWVAMAPVAWSSGPRDDSVPALDDIRAAVDLEVGRTLTAESN